MAVLDTMIQPLEVQQETYIVYYHILDGDQHGRAPNHPDYDGFSKSCFHTIAQSNDKVITKVPIMLFGLQVPIRL